MRCDIILRKHAAPTRKADIKQSAVRARTINVSGRCVQLRCDLGREGGVRRVEHVHVFDPRGLRREVINREARLVVRPRGKVASESRDAVVEAEASDEDELFSRGSEGRELERER
jgi:hypothetical protein